MLTFTKIAANCDGSKIRAYLTQENPEPDPYDVSGNDRTNARHDKAPMNWRSDMPAEIAAAIGIENPAARPRYAELDFILEGRRADNGEAWTQNPLSHSGFEFTFTPHKSISLAAKFAPEKSEQKLLRTAINKANDAALKYLAPELGKLPNSADIGAIGWVTFAHEATRPLVMLEDGRGGAVYPFELPLAGVPDYHLHNFIPNVVATRGGRTNSINSHGITENAIKEFGAVFQAYLGENLRGLGVRVGYDATKNAVVALNIPEKAIALFS